MTRYPSANHVTRASDANTAGLLVGSRSLVVDRCATVDGVIASTLAKPNTKIVAPVVASRSRRGRA
jgi:hypothetical protein